MASKNIKTKIYINVVLYWCKTWAFIWKEEHMMRVFENRVLKMKFGTKREEVTGEWRRLNNEEFYDLYSSPNIIQVMKQKTKWMEHVVRVGERRGAYRVLVRKSEKWNPLEDLRIFGRIIFKLIIKKWDGDVDWIDLVQERDSWRDLVNEIMNVQFP